MTNRNYRRHSVRHSISFAHWIDNVKCEGEDGNGQPAYFVSPRVLKNYWTWDRVQEILKDDPAVVAEIETIRNAYIRVFSILVLTDRLYCLADFMKYGLDDERLPLERRPPRWPENKYLDDAFEDFQSRQWKFCPLQTSSHTLTGQRLDNRHILPFTSKKLLSETYESKVIQATFHQDCIGEGLPVTMVLKAYTHPSTAERLYKAEVNAFTKIRNSAPNAMSVKPQYIIEYYGHFVQNGKYYILIEYAAHGSLNSYFERVTPPKSAEDMFRFWQSMFRILEGITLIHNLGGPGERTTTAFLGSHQDIKPDNILRTENESGNEYDITLKLIDFGISDIWQVSDGDPDALGQYKKGDPRYSAPECVANYDSLRRLDNRVGSEVDIWSLGCVFSEAAVWAVCGQRGRRDYLQHRKRETREYDSLVQSGFEGCFHNGTTPLKAVTLMHNDISKSRRRWDTITVRVIQLIEESMLLEHMGPRKSARELLQLSGRLIQEARKEAQSKEFTRPISSSSSYRNNITMEEHQLDSMSRASPLPLPLPPPTTSSKITVEEIQQYRTDIKEHRPPNKNVDDVCRSLQKKITGRDQMFLIDDSNSMKTQHREDVFRTFIALSYLAKRIDGDGLDLFFTSQPSKVYHHRGTTRLFQEVKQNYNNSNSGSSTMEASMSEVIDHIIEKKLRSPFSTAIPKISRLWNRRRKITIFVFTDGKWGDGTKFALVEQINRLIAEVKLRRLSRIWVVIQFIRFGNDPEGIERLKYLDDFSKDSGNWDVVDTKSHRDHVPDMFIGSIDYEVDNNDDDDAVNTSLLDGL